MARDNQVRMPTSSAGVLSFYDDEESTIRLSPTHVVVLCIVVALVIMFLNYWR